MGGAIDKVMNIGRTSSADAAATASRNAAAFAGQAAQANEAELQNLVGMAQTGANQADDFSRRIASAVNPEQLAGFDQAISRQGQNLAQQSKLFASLDPAIMEASQQALSILRGEGSAQTTGLRKRRQRDRQKLLDRLREQLGPGAETSTAGMQALNQFDAETSGLEQQTLGQLFQMGQSGAMGRSALNQGAGMLGNLTGQRANTMAGVLSQAGTMQQQGRAGLLNAQLARAGGAGSQFVAGQLESQGNLAQAQQARSENLQIGSMLAGAGMQAATGGAAGAGGAGAGAAGGMQMSSGFKDFMGMAK